MLKMTVSVAILNFNRPDYIKSQVIPELLKNKLIDEILISNGKKETSLAGDLLKFNAGNKIKNLEHWGEMNKEYGLTLRFLTASQAKNDFVLIIDDDIIPSKITIEVLYSAIKNNPDIIHGIYGRNIKNGYSYQNVFGDVPIVLTRCLMTTKEKCKYFMENFRLYETEKIKKAKPYWNGEDILFSLLSVQATGKMNRAYDLPHDNRIWNYLNFSESISVGGDHINYRKELTQELVDKMKITEIIDKRTRISKKKYQFTYFYENSYLRKISGYMTFGLSNYILDCF